MIEIWLVFEYCSSAVLGIITHIFARLAISIRVEVHLPIILLGNDAGAKSQKGGSEMEAHDGLIVMVGVIWRMALRDVAFVDTEYKAPN